MNNLAMEHSHASSINALVNSNTTRSPLRGNTSRSLKGVLCGESQVSANSAKKRSMGYSLLGSPGRLGHSPRIADIFAKARRSLTEVHPLSGNSMTHTTNRIDTVFAEETKETTCRDGLAQSAALDIDDYRDEHSMMSTNFSNEKWSTVIANESVSRCGRRSDPPLFIEPQSARFKSDETDKSPTAARSIETLNMSSTSDIDETGQRIITSLEKLLQTPSPCSISKSLKTTRAISRFASQKCYDINQISTSPLKYDAANAERSSKCEMMVSGCPSTHRPDTYCGNIYRPNVCAPLHKAYKSHVDFQCEHQPGNVSWTSEQEEELHRVPPKYMQIDTNYYDPHLHSPSRNTENYPYCVNSTMESLNAEHEQGHGLARPPQTRTGYAQIVPFDEIQTSTYHDTKRSCSSTSWTDDDAFYHGSRGRRRNAIQHWVAELPKEVKDYEVNLAETELVPLSPDVEVERGSMRLRVRKSVKRKGSFGDVDVFT